MIAFNNCGEHPIEPWKDFATFAATYDTYQLNPSNEFVHDLEIPKWHIPSAVVLKISLIFAIS